MTSIELGVMPSELMIITSHQTFSDPFWHLTNPNYFDQTNLLQYKHFWYKYFLRALSKEYFFQTKITNLIIRDKYHRAISEQTPEV